MSVDLPSGVPRWLNDLFGDPIWERRSSDSALHLLDGTGTDQSRPWETNSEPSREPLEWCMPWMATDENSTAVVQASVTGASDEPATERITSLSRLGDCYWAERGWVLLLMTELAEANSLTSCTEGDPTT